MYDLITLKFQIADFSEVKRISEKFILKPTGTTGITSNKEALGLNQCKGIFITHNEKNKLNFKIDFSLHKFWNISNNRQSQSFNDFRFKDCKNAMIDFCDHTGISINTLNNAVVSYFEIGCNVSSYYSYEILKNRFKSIVSQGKKYPILDERNLDKDSLIGTRKTPKSRLEFVIYDKTKETLKHTNIEDVPPNIIRFEKRQMRKEIYLKDLFEKEFVKMQKKKLIENINSIEWEILKKDTRVLLYENVVKNGLESVIKYQKTLFEIKEISKSSFYRNMEILRDIEAGKYKPKAILSDIENRFLTQIFNKIDFIMS